MKIRLLPIIVLALGVSACGNKTMYQWSEYQPALLGYYKGGDVAKFEERLGQSISDAEAAKSVPPGMYAEMGYLLYERGDLTGAVSFFGKERDRWPESTIFMTRLINRINAAPSTPTAPTMALPAVSSSVSSDITTPENAGKDNAINTPDGTGSN